MSGTADYRFLFPWSKPVIRIESLTICDDSAIDSVSFMLMSAIGFT